MYRHTDNLNTPIELAVGKVVCAGRNYLDHIQEMKSDVPDEPLLFMKPASALCSMHDPIIIPADRGPCHNELEVALLIGQRLCHSDQYSALEAVHSVGLGLDLTLREVQAQLKEKGHPWERAKAFDGSCPVSQFIPAVQFTDLDQLVFSLEVNGEMRQEGNSGMMMHTMGQLLALISRHFTLEPGDIVMTGTPKGVGPLAQDDTIRARLQSSLDITTSVVAV